MPLNKGYLTAKSNKESDEMFTPFYAVEPLLKYIKLNRFHNIWCPFDYSDSAYVQYFRDKGFNVINTHIDFGENFFYFEPEEEYEVIISNPPFSMKDDVLKRLYELNKPYAILLPVPALQGQKRFAYIKDSQILVFDKRINYYQNPQMTIIKKGVSFGSMYVCKDFLPEKLIFEELEILE